MDGIEHGTRKGYNKCRRRPEGSCPPCRQASSKYMAEWRKERPLAARRAAREDNARERALWRLAQRHPAEFRALVEDEKSRDGEVAA